MSKFDPIDPSEFIGFEWDRGNQYKSKTKHDVASQESEEIFFNKPLFFFADAKHSQLEKRILAYGVTNNKRLLTAIFTIRGKRIRIISARDMNKNERRSYEKLQKSA